MFQCLLKFLTSFMKDVNDIQKSNILPDSDKRAMVKFAVIDDKKLQIANILENSYQFNITELGDVQSVSVLSEYHVVLCDIRGVGKVFKSRHEGGELIKEIKKKYPHKLLIAYSASTFDPDFNEFFKLCDNVIKKDVSPEDWVATLDDAIGKAIDPKFRWTRIRELLFANNISTKDVAVLEDRYVRCINHKKFTENDFNSITNKMPDIVKEALTDLVKTALFSAVKGEVSL